ncbi:amine oxidase [Streptomyces filipinensis]|uniref:Amine oxidase n=1 Tax=Streptomyces filipinensis TaxID=66887 RepID=A0A918MAX4_9ACTN|nr:FAD-dependent oxidoreductase [Streptomyces filipinensis]GGU90670.1 amine oxidase [Streptomyces filipinensis]
METDILVIGAGAAGLACARRLHDAGLAVVVHEARRRLGGRVRTHHPDDGGPPLELGAQVVHGDRNPVHALAGAGRIRPLPRDTAAQVVLDGECRDMAVLSRGRRAPWLVEAQLHAAPGPAGLSVGGWLRGRGLTGPEHAAATEWFRQNWAAEPDRLSAPALAAAQRGDLCGSGEYTVDGGLGTVPALLADGLDVRLGSPVREVRHRPGRISAHTGEGTLTAAAAVVTVPPAVVTAGGLGLPGLPAAKHAAAARLPLGDACCAIVTLDRPAPASTVTLDVDGRMGFLRVTEGRPEVVVVAKAAAAGTVRAALADQETLLRMLRTALPWAADARITRVVPADWGADPLSGGGFCAPLVGAEAAASAWAEPVAGTVFFAGEATRCGSGLPWLGSALLSGELAAAQVLEAVRR